MQIQLEPQQKVEPLDDATKAALEEGYAAIERGEIVTLEQSQINARERFKAWQKTPQAATIPA